MVNLEKKCQDMKLSEIFKQLLQSGGPYEERRLREEILTEIEIWTDLLASGKKVSYDHIKRRLSQLNGSLLYPGMPMDEMVER